MVNELGDRVKEESRTRNWNEFKQSEDFARRFKVWWNRLFESLQIMIFSSAARSKLSAINSRLQYVGRVPNEHFHIG